jgi:hypothetical protein
MIKRRGYLPPGRGILGNRLAPAGTDTTIPITRASPATDTAPTKLPSSQVWPRVVSSIANFTRLALVLLCIGLFFWAFGYESSGVRSVPPVILVVLLVLSSFGLLFSAYALFRGFSSPHVSVIPRAIMLFANAAILTTAIAHFLIKDGSFLKNWSTVIFLISGLLIVVSMTMPTLARRPPDPRWPKRHGRVDGW